VIFHHVSFYQIISDFATSAACAKQLMMAAFLSDDITHPNRRSECRA
jgi:hypothetical protein